jgi:hypothetical protein
MREVLGHCEVCGGEIYAGNKEYYGDEYYEILDGELVHEDCLREYCDERFRKGGDYEDDSDYFLEGER